MGTNRTSIPRGVDWRGAIAPFALLMVLVAAGCSGGSDDNEVAANETSSSAFTESTEPEEAFLTETTPFETSTVDPLVTITVTSARRSSNTTSATRGTSGTISSGTGSGSGGGSGGTSGTGTTRPVGTTAPGSGGSGGSNPSAIAVVPRYPFGPGFHSLSDVHGHVFRDDNANGRLDVGEKGLCGLTVKVTGEGRTVTDQTHEFDGQYAPDNAPNKYRVTIDAPSGYRFTTPANYDVDLSIDRADDRDFGLIGPSDGRFGCPARRIAVTGRVFLDLDGDGLPGANETGLCGATFALSIVDDSGRILATDEHATTSNFEIDVFAGHYTLVANAPNGFDATTPLRHDLTLGPEVSIDRSFGFRAQPGTTVGNTCAPAPAPATTTPTSAAA